MLHKLAPSLQCAKILVFATALLIGLGACATIPSDGPDTDWIIADSADAHLEIYTIDQDVAALVAREHKPSLLRNLKGNQRSRTPVLGAGDVIGVTVWESVDGGLFASGGSHGLRSAALSDILIDRQNMAYIPYAGRLQLGGKTVEGARQLIQTKLAKQTLKPQVEVRLKLDKNHRVAVTGLVGKPGLYPLNLADGSGRLIETIASAGGAQGKPHRTAVRVVRGKRQGSIVLGRLHSHPAYDVNLMPGDKVIVSDTPRTFTVLGAINKTSEHEFTKWNFSLVDALALAGGLADGRADRTGVFVFRFEHPKVTQALRRHSGRESANAASRVPVIYQLNLLEPQSVFHAKAFQMQDQDTLFVTNAPLHQWNKVLSAASKAVFLARSGVSFAD